MRRLIGVLAVVAAGMAGMTGPAPAAALPGSIYELDGGAGAQTGASNRLFVQMSGPKVKGYEWSAEAYRATPRSRPQLTIRFVRSGAQDTQYQVSEFSWTLPRRAVRVDARDLKPVSLQTGKSMGDNGFVDMRLTRTEHYLRAPAEEGCTGSISFRIGRLGGRLRFNARDQYFGRISMKGAPVFVYREHDYRCRGDSPPPPACPEELSLAADDEGSGVSITAFKTPEGKVDQTVVVRRALETGHALHTIGVGIAVPEAFEASDDLTSANVDGDAAGPWLSGDLSFVGPPASESEDASCGPHQSSSGIVTGDYTAHFDSIGDVTPATTGLPAILRREI
jgi:hypothetical protein